MLRNFTAVCATAALANALLLDLNKNGNGRKNGHNKWNAVDEDGFGGWEMDPDFPMYISAEAFDECIRLAGDDDDWFNECCSLAGLLGCGRGPNAPLPPPSAYPEP